MIEESSANPWRVPKLTIVVVHWNTPADLDRCLRAIGAAGRLDVETIVVDNASDGIDMLPWNEYPGSVRLIRNTINEGYARATNKGLEAAAGEIVLLLNPDVVINGDGLKHLTETLERSGAGGATARLDGPDGGFQRYYTRFPSVFALVARLTVLEPLLRNSRKVREYLMLDMDPEKPLNVETAPGACLMLTRRALEAVGMMDERFPLFFNDVDYCRRMRERALEIVYAPEARFVHGAQASVEKLPAAIRAAELRLSAVRYIRKHHGLFKATLLKWAILKDLAFRVFASMALALVGARPATEFRSRLRGFYMFVGNRSLFERPHGGPSSNECF